MLATLPISAAPPPQPPGTASATAIPGAAATPLAASAISGEGAVGLGFQQQLAAVLAQASGGAADPSSKMTTRQSAGATPGRNAIAQKASPAPTGELPDTADASAAQSPQLQVQPQPAGANLPVLPDGLDDAPDKATVVTGPRARSAEKGSPATIRTKANRGAAPSPEVGQASGPTVAPQADLSGVLGGMTASGTVAASGVAIAVQRSRPDQGLSRTGVTLRAEAPQAGARDHLDKSASDSASNATQATVNPNTPAPASGIPAAADAAQTGSPQPPQPAHFQAAATLALGAPLAAEAPRSAVAAPPAVAESSPATPASASPAEQLAAPMVALSQGPAGRQSVTVRLDPAALGSVQVRIDRTKDGTATVAVTVERPETLALLLRDQPQLHRALDQAGLPADGRTVAFHMSGASGSEPGTFTDDRQGAQTQSQSGGGAAGARRGGRSDDDVTPAAASASPVRWQRAGLDITA